MKKRIHQLSTLMLAMCFSLGILLPATSAMAVMKTDINSASLKQLEAVKGIGHDTAQNILDYRKKHGKFTSMKEIEAVNGVGKVRSEALKEAFVVKVKKSKK